MGLFICIFVSVLIFLAFYFGMKYGQQIESDAFDELRNLRAALVRTGVGVETYLTGDVKKVHAAIIKVVNKL